ncbi:hypothetical protein [Clostridium algidicarnis]|mgnify:CR=1 FL=1|uniref:Lipoprotein n=1 Tax=Clostridium algidicarnis DSM 15099 TaxID=1121295 RepID=A0A2S6FWW9_9CLOT|nr:hypothetical protein [Clostridium algidicarnis]MBB6697414.1 hypothetical protein [Clostridium algidicarnis]MBU3202681.1 hypothetical protein [Clostridium algidicarnis]MBU3210835.1 hypothetical protein [Clostridium algidicarnis]MBU3222657.1 hypothetical protein [Clostridium algidicarnis]PPK47995.1 hypothetical protein BD821_11155 [Clostridium algidicarnis DSM 15099]
MKKVIGILSIVLFTIITFQSCAAGLGNAMESSKEASGSAGFMLALAWLIAGIILLCSKKSKGMVITSIVFYALAGIIGIANVGSFKDLMIWAVVSFIFTALLIFHLVKNKELYIKQPKNIVG